jgi:excisionase family DNA binding protein
VAGKTIQSKRRHKRLLASIELSREIYWTEEIPAEDLTAQVLLALLQLSCISPTPLARERLQAYVRDTFRIPVPKAVPGAERYQAREAIAFLATDSVLNHWSFPEDSRAFRKYVKIKVRFASREYFGSYDRSEQCARLAGSNLDDARLDDVPSWDARKEQARVWQSSLSGLAPQPSTLKDEMTVDESALYLNRSKGYVYRLIRQQRIAKSATGGSLKLLGEDVAGAGRILDVRRIRQSKRKALEAPERLHSLREKRSLVV